MARRHRTRRMRYQRWPPLISRSAASMLPEQGATVCEARGVVPSWFACVFVCVCVRVWEAMLTRMECQVDCKHKCRFHYDHLHIGTAPLSVTNECHTPSVALVLQHSPRNDRFPSCSASSSMVISLSSKELPGLELAKYLRRSALDGHVPTVSSQVSTSLQLSFDRLNFFPATLVRWPVAWRGMRMPPAIISAHAECADHRSKPGSDGAMSDIVDDTDESNEE